VHCLLLAGKSAFSFFQPDLPGGVFQYFTLAENKAEEDTFNKLMTTFTKTMDAGVAKLHVSCCWSYPYSMRPCLFMMHIQPAQALTLRLAHVCTCALQLSNSRLILRCAAEG
jgi:hypothetical protein